MSTAPSPLEERNVLEAYWGRLVTALPDRAARIEAEVDQALASEVPARRHSAF